MSNIRFQQNNDGGKFSMRHSTVISRILTHRFKSCANISCEKKLKISHNKNIQKRMNRKLKYTRRSSNWKTLKDERCELRLREQRMWPQSVKVNNGNHFLYLLSPVKCRYILYQQWSLKEVLNFTNEATQIRKEYDMSSSLNKSIQYKSLSPNSKGLT